ncbi:uncharacterized protein LOC123395688 [Hordeum vulgare subsp. vulgare]|uniref:uncharacterized protein LOC123395688 n=1 Tax=Hordeum vulgare subsp. vulgare TaxID=112509 RepID=UPI001D1A4BF7|nr:uncharacterized protein LOC123395688 [Hordeum vulgare subsp. vulgare]
MVQRGPADDPALVQRQGRRMGGVNASVKSSSLPEKVTSALLLGSFVALAFRSSEQQGEIEELEARKSSLRAANSAMSSTMWVWREELFKLSAMPSLPIIATPLRHIYGEEDLAIPALKTSGMHLAAAFP